MKSCIWISILIVTIDQSWGQDAGEIVNSLSAHTECGTHDWQVVDVGANCGNNPACSYPQSWCSNENGTPACVTLPAACQNVLKNEVSTSTTGAPSDSTTSPTSPATEVTQPTDAVTSAPPLVTEPPLATLAPIDVPSPITDTVEPPLRPLPVGPDGQKIVFFKVVGNLRPNCGDNSNFCCYWARNNECNDNAFFMQTYCRRSCQELRRGGPDAIGRPLKPGELITIGGDQQFAVGENAFGEPPGGSTCQDLHPKCKLWAERGECKRNSLFMVSICRPSCGQCPPCVPKCQTTCQGFPGGGGGGAGVYGAPGGCQQTCSGCAAGR